MVTVTVMVVMVVMMMAGALIPWTVAAMVLVPGAGSKPSREMFCAWSDDTASNSSAAGHGLPARSHNDTIPCLENSHCYGLWEKEPSGNYRIIKQGCWLQPGEKLNCRQSECLVSVPPTNILNGRSRFCCCVGNMCNANFTETYITPPHPTNVLPLGPPMNGSYREQAVIIAFTSVCTAAVIIIILFLIFRLYTVKRKGSFHNINLIEAPSLPSLALDSLKLIEVIGRGRYASVWKGMLEEQPVAVKVLGAGSRHNFVTEKEMYRQPLMEHENIARFIAAEERVRQDGRPEYIIILEYYPDGSLASYLSRVSSDWLASCKLAHSVSRGLAYLHAELVRGDQHKPALAHRDLNSRNVLVRGDGSCVLSDLGFTMRLSGQRLVRPGEEEAAAISEVGTIRYMAPEVLEGAVNLCDCESALKQVDVYSLGLVYWEIFTRCTNLFPGESVPDFQLAFQEEAGSHPTVEEMQVLVSREKRRPRFPDTWKENSLAVRSLKETMEDCWDQDADARLTADCAEERIAELAMAWERSRPLSPTGNSNVHATPCLPAHQAGHSERNTVQNRRFPRTGLSDGDGASRSTDARADSSISTSTSVSGAATEKNLQNMGRGWHGAPPGSPETSLTTLSSATPTGDDTATGVPVRNVAGMLLLDDATAAEASRVAAASGPTPARLQMMAADLQAVKLDPTEVDKNLKDSSDENLTETASSKCFDGAALKLGPLVQLAASAIGDKQRRTAPPDARLLRSQALQTPPRPPLPKQPNVAARVRPSTLPLQLTTTANGRGLRAKAGNGRDEKSNIRHEAAAATVAVNAARPVAETAVEDDRRPGESATREAAIGLSTARDSTSQSPSVQDEHAPLLSGERHHSRGRSGNSNNSNNNSGGADADGVGGSGTGGVGGSGAGGVGGGGAGGGCDCSGTVAEENARGIVAACQSRSLAERRLRRPNSLDLGKALFGGVSREAGQLPIQAERIKRRVKTPYSLRKGRPATWAALSSNAASCVDASLLSGSFSLALSGSSEDAV
ncbi:LOW QUALITY PROTEIN: bone morphogenetic protein receptor type-2-like [Lethenteron reissneri]|uniref:LOW QUALITY PROTEIN: bone morphogenetic protein receptor type-2-like n=1 Tax=Lethenteron reissneri TaxID=7753 RepID=UPI002AB7C5A5|nr:LOW QUALITY PROTEIN: bone morphogenetic protein receptor type-2-like [Lethenteron reissneri]